MYEDIFFGLAVFFISLSFTKKKNKKEYKTPPGPKPLKLFGYLITYLSIPDVYTGIKFISSLMQHFNGLAYVSTWFAGNLCGISKPEYIEQLLTSKTNINKTNLLYQKISSMPNGLITNSGELWRNHRKMVNPVFSRRMLNKFVSVFSKVSIRLCDDLAQYANGKSFYCEEVFSLHLIHSIIENMCGISNLPFSEGEIKEYIHEVEDEMQFSSDGAVFFYTHFFQRYGPRGVKTKKYFQRITHMAHQMLTTFYNDHPEALLPQNDDYEKTFLEKVSTLPEKYFVGEINNIIVAGYETTAATLSYCAAFLGIHKTEQDLCFEEIKHVLGDTDRPVEPEDLPKMKRLEACLNETMRLCPTVPAIGRQLVEDITFDKYTVPKGTHIFVLFFAVFRDPKIWQKPHEFYPDHFNSENTSRRHPYAFQPFSSGSRQCIGHRYAMMSMKVVLANILKNFIIETDMKMKEIRVTRLVTLDGCQNHIRLKPRQ